MQPGNPEHQQDGEAPLEQNNQDVHLAAQLSGHSNQQNISVGQFGNGHLPSTDGAGNTAEQWGKGPLLLANGHLLSAYGAGNTAEQWGKGPLFPAQSHGPQFFHHGQHTPYWCPQPGFMSHWVPQGQYPGLHSSNAQIPGFAIVAPRYRSMGSQ